MRSTLRIELILIARDRRSTRGLPPKLTQFLLMHAFPGYDNLGTFRPLEIFHHAIAVHIKLQVLAGPRAPNPVRKRRAVNTIAAKHAVFIYGVTSEEPDTPRHRGAILFVRSTTSRVGSELLNRCVCQNLDEVHVSRENKETIRPCTVGWHIPAIRIEPSRNHSPGSKHLPARYALPKRLARIRLQSIAKGLSGLNSPQVLGRTNSNAISTRLGRLQSTAPRMSASGIAVCAVMLALVVGWYTALGLGYVHSFYVLAA